MTFWNQARTEQLKTLWGDGYSASHIAGQIGAPSRNAVLGKAWRLGLKERQKSKLSPREYAFKLERTRLERNARSRERHEELVKFRKAVSQNPYLVALRGDEAKDLPPDQSPLAKSFKAIGQGECRWPIGDPADIVSFRFCAATAHPDKPYCARHCALAYTDPLKRQKKAA